MSAPAPVQVRRLRTAADFLAHAAALGVALPLDEAVATGEGAPLAQHLACGAVLWAGNRFAILPMEGWDGTPDGRPTDLVRRRWRRFGESGAGLIWGGEAVAVRPDGRANPRQLVLTRETAGDVAALRGELVDAHRARFGSDDGLVLGLQLTHSGRFSRPTDAGPAPVVAYRHPVLDGRVGGDVEPIGDEELDELAADFARAARLAAEAGFDFVDVKHCHGYLGHELLSAVDRTGRYGGSFEHRTQFLRTVVDGIRAQAPGLEIGVRVSAFDVMPFVAGPDGRGEPDASAPMPYPYAFGGDDTGLGLDLTEPCRLLDLCAELGIRLVCVTGGSPYYSPHVQRPAWFPPSDGYTPPEDPLVGVARMLDVTARLAASHPDLVVVGSGYSYLQEWLPNVAQAVVASGGASAVGLGRMALAYPSFPADVLSGSPIDGRRLCRTFSDCTTAPRNGAVSGCYPLDDFYKSMPERTIVTRAKKAAVGKPAGRG